VGALIFATALILMLHQTHVGFLRELLERLRWLPFVLLGFGVLVETALSGRSGRRFHGFDTYIVLWLAFALGSAFYSIAPSLTLGRAATLVLMYVAVFWAVWRYAGRKGEESVVELVLLAALVVFGGGLLLAPLLGGLTFGERFSGLMENPNSVGLLTALLMPLAVERLFSRGRFRDYLLVAVMVVGIVLSGSRGGMLATLFGTTYVLWKARKRVFVVGLLASLAATILILASPREREAELVVDPYVRAGTLATGSGRVEVWPVAMHIIGQRPFFGHGFGTEDLLFQSYGYDPESFLQHTGSYLHNSYLGLTAQLGLVGALAFFLPLIFFAYRRIRASFGDARLEVTHALEGTLIAALVACLFESWIYSMGNSQAFPFWVCLALLFRRSHPTKTSAAGATRAGMQ
jgi:O-antigen ligase